MLNVVTVLNAAVIGGSDGRGSYGNQESGVNAKGVTSSMREGEKGE